MNLEKLKRMIWLANKNPNEHESNLAARRVCTALAENDFALLYDNKRPNKTAYDKVNQPRTWNDVTRSTEPAFRSKQYEQPKNSPFDTIFEEMFNRARGKPFSRGAWTDSAPHKDAPEPGSWTREYPFDKSPYTSNYNPDGTKKKKPEELRKCARCGLEIMTTRLNERPWVCNPCHWKDYP